MPELELPEAPLPQSLTNYEADVIHPLTSKEDGGDEVRLHFDGGDGKKKKGRDRVKCCKIGGVIVVVLFVVFTGER